MLSPNTLFTGARASSGAPPGPLQEPFWAKLRGIMRKQAILALLGVLVLLGGCAPRYRWAVDIRFDPVTIEHERLDGKRVGVFVVSDDLGQRMRLEAIFRRHLQECSQVIVLSTATDIYPWLVGKKTDSERVKALRSRADYLLVVEPRLGVTKDSVYIPPSYRTTGSYSYNPYLQSGSFDFTTKQRGGETITFLKPYGSFTLTFISLKPQDQERPIKWLAAASARGNAFARVSDLFELLAYKTARAWTEAGMCSAAE